MAFSVELVDAPAVAQDATTAVTDGIQLHDNHALYRGVFWQVCTTKY